LSIGYLCLITGLSDGEGYGPADGYGVFVAAIEEGSLVSAARRFGLSASMAGKHVSAIEERLKVRLLQRSTRMLKLTDVGHAYYARCKHILEEYEDANREAVESQEIVRGVLRIAAPATFGAMHLGGVVASYLSEYPDVSVETTLSDHYVDLLADGIDVAIRIGRLKDSRPRRPPACPVPHGILCGSGVFWHGTVYREPRTISVRLHDSRSVKRFQPGIGRSRTLTETLTLSMARCGWLRTICRCCWPRYWRMLALLMDQASFSARPLLTEISAF
jgi:DNA-binding transcriptional LysR family regulator